MQQLLFVWPGRQNCWCGPVQTCYNAGMSIFIEFILDLLVGSAVDKAVDKYVKPRAVLSRVIFGVVMAGLLVAGIVFIATGEGFAGWLLLGIFIFIAAIMTWAVLATRRKRKADPER